MKRLVFFLIIVLCVMAFSGCATRQWHVRAYDLEGDLIYEGDVETKGNQYMKTLDGKQVRIYNSTVIFEEK